MGGGAYLKVSEIHIEFDEERVEYLKTLGWIITESL
jgi:hypothetical protein